MKIYIICFLITSIAFSQKKQKDSTFVSRRYVSIAYFKENGKTLTKEDSLSFVFSNKDTLVPVSDSFEFYEKGTQVRYEPKDSLFLETYKNVVYGTDSKDSISRKYMRYWKDPISIYFHKSVPKRHRKELMKFAHKLSKKIDSLTIREVKDWDDSNYLVYYLDQENNIELNSQMNNASASYRENWNDKSQINRAATRIDTRKVTDQHYQLILLKYRFFQSLGYFSSSKQLACSNYFSACRSVRELSKTDLELLAYHYSYGICKGIDLNTFEKLHRENKEKLRENPNSEIYFMHTED